LANSRNEFEQLAGQLEDKWKSLSALLGQQELQIFEAGKDAASDYVNSTRSMYSKREEVFRLNNQIDSQFSEFRFAAEDAGANLLDMSYLDGAEGNPPL